MQLSNLGIICKQFRKTLGKHCFSLEFIEFTSDRRGREVAAGFPISLADELCGVPMADPVHCRRGQKRRCGEPSILRAGEPAFLLVRRAGRSFAIETRPAHDELNINAPSATRTKSVLEAENIVTASSKQTRHLKVTLLLAVDGESLSLCVQLVEQRRGLPEFPVQLVKFKNAAVDILEVNGIRVPHWSAAMSGEAIAVDVDDVDVPGAQCVAFFEDARAFVYQGVEAAVHNFFAGNLPLRNFRFRRPFSYQSGYFRIGDGAPIFVVFVPPRSVFLAESPHFAKAVSREGLANAGFLKMSVLLANSPANIESREVSHGQRSHGQAEIVERAVDFLNGRSFFQQKY